MVKIGSFAFIGENPNLIIFFKMLGINCFKNINEINKDIYKIVLVEEPLFNKINLRNYLGKIIILPFRTTKTSLKNKEWINNLINGEMYHETID